MTHSPTFMLDPEYVVPSKTSIGQLHFWQRMNEQASNVSLKLGPHTMAKLGDLAAKPPRVHGLPVGDFWTIIGKYTSRGFSAQATLRPICQQHLAGAYVPQLGDSTNDQTLQLDIEASGSAERLLLFSPLSQSLVPDPNCSVCCASKVAVARSATSEEDVIVLAAPTMRAAMREGGNHSLDAIQEEADSLFPNLTFSDAAWSRVRTLVGAEETIFEDVMSHLEVLNNNAAAIWKSYSITRDRTIAFGAAGVIASPEGPAKHKDKDAMKARVFRFGDLKLTCEWHTKLQPTTNRIYFAVEDGTVFVGVITDHLP
jgi:hypothetical protein